MWRVAAADAAATEVERDLLAVDALSTDILTLHVFSLSFYSTSGALVIPIEKLSQKERPELNVGEKNMK